MASFLDKLLSPSVARDIGAMGVRGTSEYPSSFMDAAKEWYDDNIRSGSTGGRGGFTNFDDLPSDTKQTITDYLIGNINKDELIRNIDFGDVTEGVTFTSGQDFQTIINNFENLLSSSGDIANYKENLPSQLKSPESFGGIGFNPLSRESILENLPDVGQKYREDTYEGNAENLLQSVKPLTMEQIRKTTTGFYNPYIEKEKKPLVDRLIDKRKTATALGGDFAGYGQREQYQDIAEGSFMSGVENIYSDVDAERASALDDLYGTIASWQDVGEIA
jgi:hypothetical protein